MRTWMVLLLFGQLALAQGSSYNNSRGWWDANQDEVFPWDSDYENTTGVLRVSVKNGSFRTGDHPFFRALGTNGRACVTCHQPSSAMSISVKTVQERWTATNGNDPLFAAIDGSNCPTLPQAERASHSLLLDRGLFRIGLPWPPKGVAPDFKIEVVHDPTGCAIFNGEISVYRRPRVAANLTKLVAGPHGEVFMADGREPTLRDQAITAALIHEQAKSAPSTDELRRILDFETQLTANQYADFRGGLIEHLKGPMDGFQEKFRTSVVRGKTLFDAHCMSCHEAGTTRWRTIATKQSPDLPLFKVTCDRGPTVTTQDPGRALISGKCADVGAIVVPQFFGLTSRAPYFSNGSAMTLQELVESYQERLKIRLEPGQRQDLVNYLSTL